MSKSSFTVQLTAVAIRSLTVFLWFFTLTFFFSVFFDLHGTGKVKIGVNYFCNKPKKVFEKLFDDYLLQNLQITRNHVSLPTVSSMPT